MNNLSALSSPEKPRDRNTLPFLVGAIRKYLRRHREEAGAEEEALQERLDSIKSRIDECIDKPEPPMKLSRYEGAPQVSINNPEFIRLVISKKPDTGLYSISALSQPYLIHRDRGAREPKPVIVTTCTDIVIDGSNAFISTKARSTSSKTLQEFSEAPVSAEPPIRRYEALGPGEADEWLMAIHPVTASEDSNEC